MSCDADIIGISVLDKILMLHINLATRTLNKDTKHLTQLISFLPI